MAKPPRFTGDKKNWEGFILAVDTYLMAYHKEFKNEEQKIWFVISYLGTDNGSQCVALDWIQNWKEENTCNHTLHADDYEKFLEDLQTAFEDPNLKVNAANDLWQLQQEPRQKQKRPEPFSSLWILSRLQDLAAKAGIGMLRQWVHDQKQREVNKDLVQLLLNIPTNKALDWLEDLHEPKQFVFPQRRRIRS